MRRSEINEIIQYTMEKSTTNDDTIDNRFYK